MEARWTQGVEAMGRAVQAAPSGKRENCGRMQALGEFILCCVRTTINVKQWWQLRQELKAATTREETASVLEGMKTLAEAEIANVSEAIPLVEFDSRLGWEPSMEYMADREHLEWKIAQVRQVLDQEIPSCREGEPMGGATKE